MVWTYKLKVYLEHCFQSNFSSCGLQNSKFTSLFSLFYFYEIQTLKVYKYFLIMRVFLKLLTILRGTKTICPNCPFFSNTIIKIFTLYSLFYDLFSIHTLTKYIFLNQIWKLQFHYYFKQILEKVITPYIFRKKKSYRLQSK